VNHGFCTALLPHARQIQSSARAHDAAVLKKHSAKPLWWHANCFCTQVITLTNHSRGFHALQVSITKKLSRWLLLAPVALMLHAPVQAETVARYGISMSDIDEVILVGGMTAYAPRPAEGEGDIREGTA